MAKLTNKQKAFVEEYMIDLNATQAAIRAGYSEKTANRIATENLSKPDIQEYLQKRMKEREIRTEITQDFVLRELFAIAQADGSDFAKVIEKTAMQPILDAEGNQIDEKEVKYKDVELELTDNLPAAKKKAISSIKQTKFGIEVSSYDRVKALELIGKHLGMFIDKVESTNVNLNKDVSDMSDDELDAELNKFVSR